MHSLVACSETDVVLVVAREEEEQVPPRLKVYSR
jgi:hypothetical protein